MNAARITKGAIASLVIGSALGYLLYQTVRSSYAYYYSVDEFVQSPHGRLLDAQTASSDNDRGPVFRLAGRIKEGTIVRNTQNMQLHFLLVGQAASIPVRFIGTAPPNLTEGKEIVVEGRISPDKAFAAHKILTRCESKYRVRLDTPVKPAKQTAGNQGNAPNAQDR